MPNACLSDLLHFKAGHAFGKAWSGARSLVHAKVVLSAARDHETGRCCEAAGCGGALRDNIVHFDEALPWHQLKMANAKFVGADLTIVLGSSLHVEPAASLPFKVRLYPGWFLACCT